MNVWSKLLAALRSDAHATGEVQAEGQVLRILDQEIRQADAGLRQTRQSLAEVMSKQRRAAESAIRSAARVAEYEQYALQALAGGDERLAREVAEKIANMDAELLAGREQAEGYADRVAQLRAAMRRAETDIRCLRQQVDTFKASASVQRAQVTMAERHGGLHTAVEALERLRLRQAEQAVRLAAAAEQKQTRPDGGQCAAGAGSDSTVAKLAHLQDKTAHSSG